ncbi:MAG TPA: hypothetical protein DEP84_23570 [Chloroflexi bacterium]|nr:hypothetical protein [Chloroflexota bacterium]
MFQRLGNLSLWIVGLILIVVAALVFIGLGDLLSVPDFGGPPPAAERSVVAQPTPPAAQPAIFTPTPGPGAPALATQVVASPETSPPAATPTGEATATP